MDTIATFSGLKCDNTACDWKDDSIAFEDYPKHINGCCPKCNEIILTQKEYDTCVKVVKATALYNKLSKFFRWFNPLHYWRLIFGDNREEVIVIHIPRKK